MKQCTVVMCSKMYRISNCSPYAVAIRIIRFKLMIDFNYIERLISDLTTNTFRLVISYVYQHMPMNCLRFIVIHKHAL
jgi:hypothetical protein